MITKINIERNMYISGKIELWKSVVFSEMWCYFDAELHVKVDKYDAFIWKKGWSQNTLGDGMPNKSRWRR